MSETTIQVVLVANVLRTLKFELSTTKNTNKDT